MPCIIFLSLNESKNKMMAATPAKATKIMKYVCRLSIVIPKKTGGGAVDVGSGYNELIVPASLLPVAIAMNQIPIISEVNLPGVNLFTIDKPIGLKNNSPTVCRKYKPVNQSMLTFNKGSPVVPNDINRNPSASRPNPIACFIGAEGSIPFLPNEPHKTAKIGASITINIGLKLWK